MYLVNMNMYDNVMPINKTSSKWYAVHGELAKSNTRKPTNATEFTEIEWEIIYNNYKMAKRNGVKYLSVQFVERRRWTTLKYAGPLLLWCNLEKRFGSASIVVFVLFYIFRFDSMPRDYVWHRKLSTNRIKRKKNTHDLHAYRLTLDESMICYRLCAHLIWWWMRAIGHFSSRSSSSHSFSKSHRSII